MHRPYFTFTIFSFCWSVCSQNKLIWNSRKIIIGSHFRVVNYHLLCNNKIFVYFHIFEKSEVFPRWKWYFYLTFLQNCHLRNISFFLRSLDNIILTGSHPSALSHEICLLFVESLGICLGKVTDGKTSEWFKIIETSCWVWFLTLDCQLLLLFCNLKVIALLKTEFDDKSNWFFKITLRWSAK